MGLLSCACDAQNEGSKTELWLAWPCWRTCSTTEDPLLLCHLPDLEFRQSRVLLLLQAD